ncbi:MAG: hypothetical protein LBT62_00725, partial [Deltaproteobacteria bacterium]|nr:hypothetical protein [Deltaproteobacteria bacterium]
MASFTESKDATVLDVFKNVVLSGVQKVDTAWTLPKWDVADLNWETRRIIDSNIEALASGKQDLLGIPIVGPGGTGKTHLLSYLCRKTLKHGGFFFLIDLSTLNSRIEDDLWGKLSFYTKESLEHLGADDRTQLARFVEMLIEVSGTPKPDDLQDFFENASLKSLLELIDQVLRNLHKNREFRQTVHAYSDFIRATFFWNSSDHEIYGIGDYWLSGGELKQEELSKYGFKSAAVKKGTIFEAFNKLIALCSGFTVLAIDQLDPLLDTVSHRELSEQHRIAAVDTLKTLGSIMAAIINSTKRTLLVATFIGENWNNLKHSNISSNMARFRKEVVLQPIASSDIAQRIITSRLTEGYKSVGFTPPYPSWPFLPIAFKGLEGISPRELLSRANNFIELCVENEKMEECKVLGPVQPVSSSEFEDIQRHYDNVVWDAQPDEIRERPDNDPFWPQALKVLAETLTYGVKLKQGCEISYSDDGKPIGKKAGHYVFLRFVDDRDENIKRQLSLWVNLTSNAKSFQSRLNSALTQSGVSEDNLSGKLGVIRFGCPPSGPVTASLAATFSKRGGQWLEPTNDDLNAMFALVEVSRKFPELFPKWCPCYDPLKKLTFIVPLFEWLIGAQDSSESRLPQASAASQTPPASKTSPASQTPPASKTSPESQTPPASETPSKSETPPASHDSPEQEEKPIET